MSEPKQCTPTEPGWYCWRGAPDRDWEMVIVCQHTHDGEPYMGAYRLWASDLEMLAEGREPSSLSIEGFTHGEWGPRIPGPERLAALEELAACGCLEPDDWGGGYSFCFFCDGREVEVDIDGPGPVIYETKHRRDCPWLRAQENQDD